MSRSERDRVERAEGVIVLATLGPLHNWDAVIFVGIVALIVLALVLHYWGPNRR